MTNIDMTTPVDFSGVPYAARIITDKRDGRGPKRSTGTIISSHCVLTCAHSVVRVDGTVISANDVHVCFPNKTYNAHGREVNEWRSGNCTIVKRDDYDFSHIGFRYDLAIIRFRQHILQVGDDPALQTHIHKINARSLVVVTPEQFLAMSDPSDGKVVGFGHNENTLRSLNCQLYEKVYVDNSCFYNSTTLAHNAPTQGGDSGGALVVESEFGPLQVGVHSQGRRDAGYDPDLGFSVAARIALREVHDWIKKNCH